MRQQFSTALEGLRMCSARSLRELGWVICLFRVPGLSSGSDPEKPVVEALGGKWLSLKGQRAGGRAHSNASPLANTAIPRGW